MIQLAAKNEAQAKKEAVQLSLKNPKRYVTIFACFGLFASVHKSLNVFAPSDSVFNWYVLNGKVKAFTQKQHTADSNQTPLLS